MIFKLIKNLLQRNCTFRYNAAEYKDYRLFSRLVGLYCLSCVDGISPRHCHTVKKCSDEEVGLQLLEFLIVTNAKQI